MTNILQFRKNTASEKAKGKTLCKRGFHKWDVLNSQQFDVKQGKLVTAYQCKRCGKIKNESH